MMETAEADEKNTASATISIAFIAVATTAFILNIIESVLIIRMRKRWKPFDKMLLSMSFADQLVAAVTIIYNFLSLYHVSIGGCKISQHHFILLLIASEDFSLFHVLAITIDRFYAIKYPLKHNVKMRGKFPVIIILSIWVCVALVVSIFATMLLLKENSFAFLAKIYSTLTIIIGICFIWAYKYMLEYVLSHTAQAQNTPKCNIRGILKHSSCKKERAMLMTSCLVVLSYIICIYPISVEMLIREKTKQISSATQILLVINSILNPLVYFFKGYCDQRIKQSIQKSSSKQESTSSQVKNELQGQKSNLFLVKRDRKNIPFKQN